jgi:hypothetical protein
LHEDGVHEYTTGAGEGEAEPAREEKRRRKKRRCARRRDIVRTSSSGNEVHTVLRCQSYGCTALGLFGPVVVREECLRAERVWSE